ncbi:MAG: phospholipase D-like domain-containing protein [Gammaproteobacteria bacterium]
MSSDFTYYGALLVVLHVFTATVATLHALLFKADSRASLGWIGIILFFPYFGALLYLLFGINRVRRKAQRRGIFGIPWSEAGFLPPARHLTQNEPPLRHAGLSITGKKLSDNNSLETLFDGEQAFPAMLKAIDEAATQVLLMTYIFDNDDTGRQFVAALGRAVARGVEVRVLVDDIGRRYDFPSILGPLRNANIDVRCFIPIRLIPPSLSLNLRNHRKLLVVDGGVGFAGGMNIGDRQLAQHPEGKGATDLHFAFRGQIVERFSKLFCDDWRRAGGDALAVLPASIPPGGSCRCRLIPDGPDNHLDHLSMLLHAVISSARSHIRIVTPYFLPHRKLVGALQSAALRGVDVCVVVPSVNNWPMVQWALAHMLWELLNVGVRVVEQPPPFAHTKCILIDDAYALIGSTNLDPRSLRLNFELGIEVFSKTFNQSLSEHVESLITVAKPIGRKDVARRGPLVRTRDATAALFSPYM